MQRREFLGYGVGALAASLTLPRLALASKPATSLAASSSSRPPDYAKLLILIELKGGNDGLNTVIPYASPKYAALRPTIGIARDKVIPLDEQTALHPSMQALMPLWQQRELAIVQGVSYPKPNLSHFRSIEIWNTASASDQYWPNGWLTRTFARQPVPAGYAADAVVIGSAEMGPLANGAHAVAIVNPQQFLRDAHLVRATANPVGNPELAHVLAVQGDIQRAADRLRPAAGQFVLRTAFPSGQFGNQIRTAMQVIAASESTSGMPVAQAGVPVIKLTLNGFDTHQNQPAQQEGLLRQFAEGLAAMRGALVDMNRWNSTLVMTYAEFGRRPRENDSRGTDHGTVAPHFVAGGAVAGGLYGVPPMLERLDGNGNLPPGVDFRSLYATVLERWWGVDPVGVLGGRFERLPLIRA